MPFVKGQSGNPAGRAKEPNSLAALARTYTEEAVNTLADIMRNGQNETARASAADKLLDRGWGKAVQAIAGADGEGPVELSLSVKFVKGSPNA